MAVVSRELVADLLKDTSRTFYLTLRVLPAAIRRQIGLAYLLARTSDTIADTEIISREQRLNALREFRERVLGSRETPLNFGDLARHQSSNPERILLEQCEVTLATLCTLSSNDLQLVRDVLNTIVSGQELDLRRFAGASGQNIVALQTDAELDDYTYRVAGCVGEFWTRMCRAHLFPSAVVDDSFLLTNGVRFGKGLQLVNILRDLPADLCKGRCYLPTEQLVTASLSLTDLLQPINEPKFRPLYHDYLHQAEEHLAAGWAYTNALPRGCARVRLACAWPILIGMKTLAKLRDNNVLDPQQRIKISRSEVKRIIFRTIACYPWPPAWRKLFPTPGK